MATALSRNTTGLRLKNVHQLWVHDAQASPEEVLLNPEAFNTLKVGDLIEIVPAERDPSAVAQENKPRLVLHVGAGSLEKKTQAAMTVSVRREVADAMQLPVRKEVVVRALVESAALDFVEIAFKDQYVSGAEMWQLKAALTNTCVHAQKKLQVGASRAVVRELVQRGSATMSGLITDHTKLVFRSRSARCFVLLQMSREMWEFSTDGHLYFERAVGFVAQLCERWRSVGCGHSVSVLLFARLLLPPGPRARPSSGLDERGRPYDDVYKVLLLDDCSAQLDHLPVLLKREFLLFAQQLHEALPEGENSSASGGNFLEAVNLVLNVMEHAHVDRDLSRTNQNLICISAGRGVFEVDRELALQTKRRMVDGALGCDLFCLAPAPLHVVPLFRPRLAPDAYSIPHWLFVSFGGDEGPAELPPDVLRAAQRRGALVPRVRRGQATFADASAAVHAAADEALFAPRRTEKLAATAAVATTPTPAPTSTPTPQRPALSLSAVNNNNNNNNNGATGSGISGSRRGRALGLSTDVAGPSLRVSSGTVPLPLSSAPLSSPASAVAVSALASSASVAAPPPLSLAGLSAAPSSPPPPPAAPLTQGAPSLALSPHAADAPQKIRRGGRGEKALEKAAEKARAPKVDPFLHEVAPPGPSSVRRRWAHLVPSTLRKHQPNWKSLIEPACLPVTTNYFPSPAELNNLYKQSVFQLSLVPDENIYQNRTEELLRELISQRLDQGFQLVVHQGPDVKAPASAAAAAALRVPKRLALGRTFHTLTYDEDAQNIQVRRYYRDAPALSRRATMGMSGSSSSSLNLQGISPSPTSSSGGLAQAPTVQTHTPTSRESLAQAPQTGGTQTQGAEEYRYRLALALPRPTPLLDLSLPLTAPPLAAYNWNLHDEIVCGYVQAFSPAIIYNRIRLVVMPLPARLTEGNGPVINEEEREQRAVQFDKLRELVREKSVATVAHPRLTVLVPLPPRPTPAPALSIPTSTSTSTSTSSASSTSSSSTATSSAVSSKNVRPTAATVAQLRDPTHGVPLRERKHLTRAHMSFTGTELLDWLQKNVENVRTVADAEAYAQRLMEARVIRQLESKATAFVGGPQAYRFRSTESRKPKKSGWLAMVSSAMIAADSSTSELPSPPPLALSASTAPSTSSSSSSTSASASSSSTAPSTSASSSSTASSSSSSSSAPPSDGYRRIDVDQRITKIVLKDPKGERQQWMLLSYDAVFEAEHAFSMEFQWVACTAPLLEEFLGLLGRKARGWGLQLAQLAAEQGAGAHAHAAHPFRRAAPVPLPPLPPPRRLSAQLALLQRLEYVCLLPSGPARSWAAYRFLHRSAAALVTLTPDGFLWQANDLLSPGRQIGSERVPIPNPSSLFAQLYDACVSPERLEAVIAADNGGAK